MVNMGDGLRTSVVNPHIWSVDGHGSHCGLPAEMLVDIDLTVSSSGGMVSKHGCAGGLLNMLTFLRRIVRFLRAKNSREEIKLNEEKEKSDNCDDRPEYTQIETQSRFSRKCGISGTFRASHSRTSSQYTRV